MRPVLLSLIAIAGLLIASVPSEAGLQAVVEAPVAADFFVSPRGKDTWSGKLADPDKGDGPFATVDRPREAIRALLKTSDRPRPVRVVLRAGAYYLDSPLELGPEDSGSPDAPVVYAAAAGERVV